MTVREHTVQQFDALGGLAARLVTLLGCAGMIAFAIVMTVYNAADIDYPAVAVIGIGIVAASAVLVAVASSPLRAPLRQGVHFAAMGLALIALVFNTASMWESNSYIRDDWGPVVLGFVALTLVPYRPPAEIVIVGTLVAIFAGFVAMLQVDQFQTRLPAMIYVIVAATPVLAMSYGGAAFSSAVLRMLRRWRSRASSAVRALGDERKTGVARSVQQDRVTILNRDVVPFFAELLERADLLESDRERASQVSDSIRRLMVAEIDRSWLDLVLEQLTGSAGQSAYGVRDPDRLAGAMSTDQRIALRAAVGAIFEHPAFDPRSFDLQIERTMHGAAVTIQVGFTPGESGARSDLAVYLAVLRVVFTELGVEFSSRTPAPTLTLRFSYDKY